jgi:membrane protein DedA with SNARE-associated domain
MEQIQPYLDYFAAHPSWALAVIFLIAFGEALLVIGLVVPSTAVLVGAGALVGTGKLEFWPVIFATAVGCILGDQVSYWAGRIFGDRLRSLWPLSAYPQLVLKGEDFIKRHGGKSIAIGRFVPGVKAVVPGIVGMFGMAQIPFLAINVTSGIVWSFVHVVPGVLLGQALALAGELSGRLLLILLVLLTVIMVAGWLIRILAGSISPYQVAMQSRIATWARSKGSKPLRRFGLAISPENPRSKILVLLIGLALLAVIAFIDLASGRMLQSAAGNFDRSLNNLFSELRSAPADELFIRITMLGDSVVPLVLSALMAFWTNHHCGKIDSSWSWFFVFRCAGNIAKFPVPQLTHCDGRYGIWHVGYFSKPGPWPLESSYCGGTLQFHCYRNCFLKTLSRCELAE